MKTAIVYASEHHNNTYRIVDALRDKYNIELIDATKIQELNLSGYDRVGFASGIYYGKFHQAVLNFAAVNLPQNKEVFFICTYGGKACFDSIIDAISSKNPRNLGSFSCKGFDTYGPFKFIGGINKRHPNENDINDALSFYDTLMKIYEE